MKEVIKVIGFVGLLTNYIVLSIVFYFAVINNGEIIVKVNYYNEMVFEIILQLLIFPCVIYYITLFFNGYKPQNNKI